MDRRVPNRARNKFHSEQQVPTLSQTLSRTCVCVCVCVLCVCVFPTAEAEKRSLQKPRRPSVVVETRRRSLAHVDHTNTSAETAGLTVSVRSGEKLTQQDFFDIFVALSVEEEEESKAGGEPERNPFFEPLKPQREGPHVQTAKGNSNLKVCVCVCVCVCVFVCECVVVCGR